MGLVHGMQGLEKLGYFLVGCGVGTGIATWLYRKELERPIGEVEIVSFEEDAEESDEEEQQRHILEMKAEIDQHGRDEAMKKTISELTKRAHDKNTRTPYHLMYNIPSGTPVGATQRAVEARKAAEPTVSRVENYEALERLSEAHDISSDDAPPDDYVEDYEEISTDADLLQERVENNFVIYLDENPQDFVSLVFWEEDSTLTDDQDQVIPNPEDVIGRVALDRLVCGGPGCDNGVIFVKNLKTSINYEVVLDAGSYSETVLGIFESRLDREAGGDVNRQ